MALPGAPHLQAGKVAGTQDQPVRHLGSGSLQGRGAATWPLQAASERNRQLTASIPRCTQLSRSLLPASRLCLSARPREEGRP